MDTEEKKRLKELSDLEGKYGDFADEFGKDDDDQKEQMSMEGASLRDIDRIKEKRKEQNKK